MRVLLASPGMSLGGAERVVVALAAGLSSRGHDVAVSGAPGPLDAELAPDVLRIPLADRGRSPAGVAEWTLRLTRHVRAFRPDVVHAHNTRAAISAGAAARLARGPRRPVLIATHHGAAGTDERAAARLLALAADEVVVVSEDLLPRFHGARVNHNGVSAPPPADPALDAELGLGNGPVIAAVGRLVPVKGGERFLRAAALISARRPDARFLVVGDGPLRGELEALAHRLGLDGAVRFTGPRRDARAIVARADLVVLASDSEGLSLAALEALAAGTPVVATPVSGMRRLAGARVASGFAADALAAAVAQLLDAPAERATLGRAGAALVRERLSEDAMMDAYEARYRALAARRRRTRPTMPSSPCS